MRTTFYAEGHMRLARFLQRIEEAIDSDDAHSSSQLTVWVRTPSTAFDAPDAWREFPVTRFELDDEERSIELEYAHREPEPALTLDGLLSALLPAVEGRDDYVVSTAEFRSFDDETGVLMVAGTVGFKWDDRDHFGVIRWYDGASDELA